MLFNSYEFLFAFLPAVFVLYWFFGRGVRWRLGVLVAASYAFYSWWDWRFTVLMIVSTSVNYLAGMLMNEPGVRRRLLLVAPIVINLAVLGIFKYLGFFSRIASDISTFIGGGALPILALLLPIGISFYTFEAISYIVDVYRGTTKPARSFLEYACFISMFPRLIAGPIVRYADLESQFDSHRKGDFGRWSFPLPDDLRVGLLLLTMGMVKKVLVADRIAVVINPLWTFAADDPSGSLGFAASWAAVLGYTFQIYFDFSGYSDIAVGLAHLFAFKLPQNFNSPYRAADPIDFWRRWHMTLSSWLRDYLYIPLGGNRTGHRARNIMITMLLGGLWHGAAWQFVAWGGWHGILLLAAHRMRDRVVLSTWLTRHGTFLLVVLGWVLFRAEGMEVAGRVFVSMSGLRATSGIDAKLLAGVPALLLACAGMWAWVNVVPNSFDVAYRARPRLSYAAISGAALACCALWFGTKTDFLYFQF